MLCCWCAVAFWYGTERGRGVPLLSIPRQRTPPEGSLWASSILLHLLHLPPPTIKPYLIYPRRSRVLPKREDTDHLSVDLEPLPSVTQRTSIEIDRQICCVCFELLRFFARFDFRVLLYTAAHVHLPSLISETPTSKVQGFPGRRGTVDGISMRDQFSRQLN